MNPPLFPHNRGKNHFGMCIIVEPSRFVKRFHGFFRTKQEPARAAGKAWHVAEKGCLPESFPDCTPLTIPRTAGGMRFLHRRARAQGHPWTQKAPFAAEAHEFRGAVSRHFSGCVMIISPIGRPSHADPPSPSSSGARPVSPFPRGADPGSAGSSTQSPATFPA